MDRPIILNAAMVRAVLSGQKTQTRRPVNPQPTVSPKGCPSWGTGHGKRRLPGVPVRACGGSKVSVPELLEDMGPFGQPGDRLWVRETWTAAMHEPKGPADCLYRADDNGGVEDLAEAKWTPSIHMPRWASRITLPLISVRVERVQDISEADAWAEGYGAHWQKRVREAGADGPLGYPDARGWFAMLWDELYGTWAQNPWVWVAEWKEIEVAK